MLKTLNHRATLPHWYAAPCRQPLVWLALGSTLGAREYTKTDRISVKTPRRSHNRQLRTQRDGAPCIVQKSPARSSWFCSWPSPVANRQMAKEDATTTATPGPLPIGSTDVCCYETAISVDISRAEVNRTSIDEIAPD
ncbi:hypothetical protein F4680DRAFT_447443 [Xylaria scruposa]|nr:hypothetical protein F4680DRAFT_447443 [Xylaria scruposa]